MSVRRASVPALLSSAEPPATPYLAMSRNSSDDKEVEAELPRAGDLRPARPGQSFASPVWRIVEQLNFVI